VVVGGLTNGVEVRFKVLAVCSLGSGPLSSYSALTRPGQCRLGSLLRCGDCHSNC
jgi:hypothetical protein